MPTPDTSKERIEEIRRDIKRGGFPAPSAVSALTKATQAGRDLLAAIDARDAEIRRLRVVVGRGIAMGTRYAAAIEEEMPHTAEALRGAVQDLRNALGTAGGEGE